VEQLNASTLTASSDAHISLYIADTYVVRRKVFTFWGAKFHVYDMQGQLRFFSKMKAFKWKEDIRLYTGEDMRTELLCIKARQIIDFSAAYDVYDSTNGQKVGALKRRGFKSILRDEWIIMDTADHEIGKVREESAFKALVRRFVPYANLLFPQKYHVEIADQVPCTLKQNFNPFVLKYLLDFTSDARGLLDRRLGIATAVLLAAIEGRQQQ
jgi:hypothetical protein